MSKRSRGIGDRSSVTASILVVEPDVLVRMTIADYLRECGYRVFETITGEEALAVLGAGVKVDTVLAAVRLQGAVDGFALAQRIRSGFSGIEIVLTTGLPMIAKKAGELCGQGPLGKHHHPELIVKRLQVLFGNRRPSEPE